MPSTICTLVCIVFTLASCGLRQPDTQHFWSDPMPRKSASNLKPDPILIRSSFHAMMWIEDGDTTWLDQYEFRLQRDTLSLEEAFKAVSIPPVFYELMIEGRVYMKTTLCNDSTFSPTQVLRQLNSHYDSIQTQIDSTLSRFRIASAPEDSAALIFYHQLEVEL